MSNRKRMSDRLVRVAVLLSLFAVPLARADTPADTPYGKPVAEIVPQGNKLRSSADIISQIKTRPETSFNLVTAQEDVNRLYSRGWFRNVSINTVVRPDDRVTVYVIVEEWSNTLAEVVYRGAQHLSDDELYKTTGLRKGMPMSPIANQSAAQAIQRKLYDDGRIFANVVLVEGGKMTDTRVVFDISEGPKVKVDSLKLNYVRAESGEVSQGRIRTVLASSSSTLGIGGSYDPAKVEADSLRIRDYYRNLGFMAASVSVERKWATDYRSLALIYHIDEGPRYQVESVKIEGNKVFTEENLLRLTDTRPNTWYSRETAQIDVERIKRYYGYTGRNCPVDEKIVETQPGVVSVSYQVTERDQVRVGSVTITGNEYTKDNVIRRNLGPLRPGQLLAPSDLAAAEQNLGKLGIFEDDPQSGVKPTVTVENPEVDEPFKNIFVNVKEKPTGSLIFSLGVNSDAGLNGSIVLNEKNYDITSFPTSFEELVSGRAFRGAGQELRLEAVPGTQFQRYSVNFREPALFDSIYSLGVGGYYYQRNFLEYNEGRLGSRVNLGRRVGQNVTLNAALRAEQVNLYDTQGFEPQEILRDAGKSMLYGLRVGASYDTRDNYLRPGSGMFIDAGYERVTGDYNYGLATLEATRYFTTYQRNDGSGKHVLSARSQVSYAGENTPVYERIYGGGYRSMRGFAFRGIGPFVGDFNVGGRFGFLNSLEYQIPIGTKENLYLVGFVDTGTVEKDVSIRDYRATVGAGLRIAVPQLLGPVPIALDFGIPINQAAGDKKQVFSFWLGFFNI